MLDKASPHHDCLETLSINSPKFHIYESWKKKIASGILISIFLFKKKLCELQNQLQNQTKTLCELQNQRENLNVIICFFWFSNQEKINKIYRAINIMVLFINSSL